MMRSEYGASDHVLFMKLRELSRMICHIIILSCILGWLASLGL